MALVANFVSLQLHAKICALLFLFFGAIPHSRVAWSLCAALRRYHARVAKHLDSDAKPRFLLDKILRICETRRVFRFKYSHRVLTVKLVATVLLLACSGAFAAVDVLTSHNALARTGQNLREMTLAPRM